MQNTNSDGILGHVGSSQNIGPIAENPLLGQPITTDSVGNMANPSEEFKPTIVADLDSRSAPATRPALQTAPSQNVAPETRSEPIVPTTSPAAPTTSQQVDPNITTPTAASQAAADRIADQGRTDAIRRANATPIIAIETTAPAEINAGRSATFKILVRNVGETTAHNLVVEANCSPSATVGRCEPAADRVSEHVIQFPPITIAPNGENVYTVELTTQECGELDVSANVRFSSQAHSQIRVGRPDLALAYLGPKGINIGSESAIKIELVNNGDGPAESVRLEAVDAGGLAIRVPDRSIERLAPGESRHIPVTILPDTPGPVPLKFIARAADGVQVESETDIRILAPRIKVETRGPHQGFVKRGLAYTISVRNEGDMDAENVNLRAEIPVGLEITDVEQSGTHDRRSNTVSWALKKISAQAGAEVSFRATVIDEGVHTLEVTGTPNVGISDAVKHTTNGHSRAHLTMNLEYDDGQLEIGESAEFTMSVRNRGTNVANNVQIGVAIPEGLRVTAIDGNEGASGVSFSPFTLAIDEQKTLRFRVTGEAPGEHVVCVSLNSESVSREVFREESVFVYDAE